MNSAKGSKLRYREGQVFAVPLRTGGYGLGLIARASPAGKVLLGYFFGPKLDNSPAAPPLLRPEEALIVARFGDLSLQNGEWPLIGDCPEWDRSMWSSTRFGRIDTVSGSGWCTTYSDSDPNKVVGDSRCTPDEALALPRDNMLGAGAVEIKLTRLLSREEREPTG